MVENHQFDQPEGVFNGSGKTQAWRCTGSGNEKSLTAFTGKWYYPTSEASDVELKDDVKATTYQLPDTRTWFTATLMEGRPLPLRSFDHHRLSELDGRCTGELGDQQDTTAESSNHLLIQRAVKKPSKAKFSSDDDTLNDQRPKDEEVPSGEDVYRDTKTTGEEKPPVKEEALSGDGAPRENPPSTNSKATEQDSSEYKYLHSCLGGDRVVAVQMQNDTSWKAQGCLPGFLSDVELQGTNNNDDLLPTFCAPLVTCQNARLAGGQCDPQGQFEPVLCPAGYYCPLGGKEKLECPAGHWCSVGSVKPEKCSIGASCPPGTNRNMSFLLPGLILAIDTIVILAMVVLSVRRHFKNKHHTSSKGKRFARLNKPASFFDKNHRAKKYHSLEDDDIALESRITHVVRSDTAFGGNFTPIDSQRDDTELISDLDMFIQSMSKCIGTERFGLSFEFTDLKFQPKKAKKPILSEVTGRIDRGSLWGVMGASGAGKSTFVNVLMGKQALTGGTTKINGVPGDIKKYKKIIGYVPQDDIVLPELTVRENILHSARIRLPSTWGDEQIQKHVDILISCLQLAHVKDSLVGSAATPVISGGQRKRVSIGIELAAAPMALFLDEPTSGLDATSASSIMMTLKELSRLDITVITIIHQPRAEIFESLDSLLLFGKGRVIYQGPEREVKPYFENLGFHFPRSGNPADTIMDIIAGQGHLYKPSGDTGIWSLIHNWKQRQESQRRHRASNASTISSLPPTPQPGLSKPLNNPNTTSTTTLTSTTSSNTKTAEALSLRRSIKSRGAPFHKQIYHCLLRSLLQQYRFRSSFFFEIGVSTLGGFLIGLAQFKAEGINFRGYYLPPYTILSSSIDYSSVPQMALLVGIAIGLIASSPGVKIFGEEKLVYWREASSGHNRLAYYIGKVLSTFPRMVIACLHFTATFMVLSTPRIDWGSAFLANLLYFYTIYGLASILSMLTRREDGPLLAVMASLIVGVLNGMSPNLSVVSDWHMSWFWRALPGTWLAEAYFEKNVNALGYLYAIEHASEGSGYRLGKFGWDCCVLGIIGTVYRVLAFLGMRFLNQRGKG
ncbi:MAG: hypothetical protein Q9186_004245 [Xanthomendoza sp. 1 TL-2023]